jgi:hypothetical protein
MKLLQPITIPIKEITLSKIDYVLMDNAEKKIAAVTLTALPISITLWTGPEYDAAGDYTQKQVEDKLKEILGSDPALKIKSLLPKNIP